MMLVLRIWQMTHPGWWPSMAQINGAYAFDISLAGLVLWLW